MRDSAAPLSDDDDASRAPDSAPPTPTAVSKARDTKEANAKHRRGPSTAPTPTADIAEYLRQKASRDEEKAIFQRERLELERRRLAAREQELAAKREAEEQKSRLDLAQRIIAMEGASDEVKAEANAILLAALRR